MAKNEMPHSQLHAPTMYNPWEEIDSSSMMFGASQVDDDDDCDTLGV
jgi:hypothetical protein